MFQRTLAIVVLATVSYDAHAYIDFGSSSLYFQGAIAGLMGIAFTVKLYWRRIKGGFKKRIEARRGKGPHAKMSAEKEQAPVDENT